MNYPKGILKQNNKITSYGNRGMGLENDINETNAFYLLHEMAVIHKKPTAITIKKIDYPGPKEAIIREGYFKTPSTTDYNGIYRGRYLDFEAKETKSTTLFPLSNIHPHQLEHLRSIIKQGGIGFLLVRFVKMQITYYLDGRDLFSFLENEARKSIPITYFEKKGYPIKDKINPRVDYLEIVKHIYFKGE